VRRTQLYLDEDLWTALRIRSRQEGTTVSDLVRRAVRERYLGNSEERKRAMQAFVGIRKDRSDLADTESYIRGLRRGSRLERLSRT
jgi:hypothetical protein